MSYKHIEVTLYEAVCSGPSWATGWIERLCKNEKVLNKRITELEEQVEFEMGQKAKAREQRDKVTKRIAELEKQVARLNKLVKKKNKAIYFLKATDGSIGV